MIAHLLTRRVLLGGLAFAVYGLWEVCARLPAGLGFRTYTISSLWVIALFAAAGMIVTALVCSFALAISRPAPLTWRAGAAATWETILWLPLILWLVLNEVVYSTTSEVVGYDAIL